MLLAPAHGQALRQFAQQRNPVGIPTRLYLTLEAIKCIACDQTIAMDTDEARSELFFNSGQ